MENTANGVNGQAALLHVTLEQALDSENVTIQNLQTMEMIVKGVTWKKNNASGMISNLSFANN